MGRAPCCDKANVKRGPWSPEEDDKLKNYMQKYGTNGGNWIALPQKAGLKRCGKSCRLRWLNYLRPNIKHGEFSDEEDRIICSLYSSIGSRWSIIAAQLPGRTDNDIKNYWNTKLKKKLIGINITPPPRKIPKLKTNPPFSFLQNSSILLPSTQNNNNYYTFPTTNSFINNNNSIIVNDPTAVVQSQNVFVGPTQNSSSQIIDGGYGDESPLDYYDDLEEIKQLISTTNVSSNLYYDEIKIEEKVLYY